jgi:hypothetical protein
MAGRFSVPQIPLPDSVGQDEHFAGVSFCFQVGKEFLLATDWQTTLGKLVGPPAIST